MNVSYSDQIDSLPLLSLIPISSGANFSNSIEAIASYFGFDEKMLFQDFYGESGELLTLHSQIQNKRVCLLGFGEQPTFEEIIQVTRSFTHKLRKKLSKDFGVCFLFENFSIVNPRGLEAFSNGISLGTYDIGLLKTEAQDPHPFEFGDSLITYFLPEANKEYQDAIDRGLKFGETQKRIFDLVNLPSNKKTPAYLGNWAIESGKRNDFKVKVLEIDKIKETNLKALLAVNQGSDLPPVFIVMEYLPKSKGPHPKVGLVGKGVTFDTGGLSIKPSSNMHYMKSDMGGAAAVLGTLELAAKLELNVHLIGIVPATENNVDAKSIKPSDIIESYSGKTIEIIDTDAEGRLILADGLAYMVKNYNPEVLIDIATLTGSAVRTLGYHAAALFSNNDKLAQRITDAGNDSGERVWRLPIWDAYYDDIKSDVADVKNYSGKPIAGAIVAAKFLEFFINNHPNWAHLDIAGVAFKDSGIWYSKELYGLWCQVVI